MRGPALTLLLLVACAPEPYRFDARGGGEATAPEDQGGGTPSDTGASLDAPVLGQPTAAWDDYPDVGRVIEVQTPCSDPDGDLEGGTLELEVYRVDDDAEPTDVFELEIDTNPWIEDDTLWFVVQPADTSVGYRLDFYVVDQAGNASNQVEAQVEADEG